MELLNIKDQIKTINTNERELNILERRFEAVKNKAVKYFLMIRSFKNLQKSDLSITMTKSQLDKMTQKELKDLLQF